MINIKLSLYLEVLHFVWQVPLGGTDWPLKQSLPYHPPHCCDPPKSVLIEPFCIEEYRKWLRNNYVFWEKVQQGYNSLCSTTIMVIATNPFKFNKTTVCLTCSILVYRQQSCLSPWSHLTVGHDRIPESEIKDEEDQRFWCY